MIIVTVAVVYVPVDVEWVKGLLVVLIAINVSDVCKQFNKGLVLINIPLLSADFKTA